MRKSVAKWKRRVEKFRSIKDLAQKEEYKGKFNTFKFEKYEKRFS